MRFYTQQHRFYWGIDLHARSFLHREAVPQRSLGPRGFASAPWVFDEPIVRMRPNGSHRDRRAITFPGCASRPWAVLCNRVAVADGIGELKELPPSAGW